MSAPEHFYASGEELGDAHHGRGRGGVKSAGVPATSTEGADKGNHYWLVGTSPTARIPLRATTQEALHAEVMGIETEFHLVLHDVMGTVIMNKFLCGCEMLVVSITIADPNVTGFAPHHLSGTSFSGSSSSSSLRYCAQDIR